MPLILPSLHTKHSHNKAPLTQKMSFRHLPGGKAISIIKGIKLYSGHEEDVQNFLKEVMRQVTVNISINCNRSEAMRETKLKICIKTSESCGNTSLESK